MKRLCTLLLMITGFVLFSCDLPTGSGKAHIDDEIQICFDMINEFRTGNYAWYWNVDDTTKTNLVGQLGKLTLDEELCKAAQIRANEIITSFSHTRPDGRDCGTVLGDLSITWTARGENIAAGNQTGKDTFLQWKEDNYKYAGQGHRRNMLNSNFTKIGIAYTYDPNSKYKYYWAMILTR